MISRDYKVTNNWGRNIGISIRLTDPVSRHITTENVVIPIGSTQRVREAVAMELVKQISSSSVMFEEVLDPIPIIVKEAPSVGRPQIKIRKPIQPIVVGAFK